MIRLFIVGEGQSEDEIVRHVLAPHLGSRGVYTSSVVVSTRRDPQTGEKARGGGYWSNWLRDLRSLLAQQRGGGVRVTTLFDLYGLPKDFPELSRHAAVSDTSRRADLLQEAMALAVGDRRLIPYLQRHELEALVLAGLDSIALALRADHDPAAIAKLRASLGNEPPEDVNDGRETAPSKRLAAAIPGYQKSVHGPLTVEAAGLPVIRAACPRFHAWLTKLEQLSEDDPA